MSELKFSSFLEEPSQDVAESVTDDATLQDSTPVSDEAYDSRQAVAEETAEEPESVEPESTEQVEPSNQVPASVTFEDRLRAKGIVLPEDLDREDLYDNAIERITAGQQAKSELEALRAELESYKSQQAQYSASTAPEVTQETAPKTPAGEPEAETPSGPFRALKKPDAQLAVYITRDENSGVAIPKHEYGQVAIEAARVFNEYERQEQEQAAMLVANPNLVFDSNISRIEQIAAERAEQIIASRLEEMKSEQQKAREQQEAQVRQEQSQQAESAWREQHEKKLFHTDADGNIQSLFGDGQPSQTPFGRTFFERLHDLKRQMPDAPDLPLRDIALREAELLHKPASEPAPQPEPVQTQLEKKKAFVQQRQEVPNQNTPQATASEAVAPRGKLKFADYARSIPEAQQTMQSWQ